jgi:hypothetical protein
MLRRFAVSALFAIALLAGSPAEAERLAVGAALGRVTGEADRSTSRGLFARVALAPRVGLFGELGRASLEDPGEGAWIAKRAAFGVRADLGAGAWTPYLLAAAGGERWYGLLWDLRLTSDHRIAELGGGLELALDRTVSIGLDVRIGERTLAQTRFRDDVVILIVPPSPPIARAYTSMHLTLTVRL